MIIVNLKGGLGNPMFQYTAGRRLAEVNKTELKLDVTFLENMQEKANVTLRKYELFALNIQENFATPQEVMKWKNAKNRMLNEFLPNPSNPYVKEKHFHFDQSVLTLADNRYLEGYWMSEKYFHDIEPIIRKEFTFRKEVLSEGRCLHSEILKSDSICIQVRRGDYVTTAAVAKMHQTTSLDYFKRAISLIKTRVENPVFFIFSDDIEWCEENLDELKSKFFAEKELSQHGATTSDYLQLMISCKHFIISNSTFAWWAAWLSSFKDKIIIAPQNWFNDRKIITEDIYPAQWIKT